MKERTSYTASLRQSHQSGADVERIAGNLRALDAIPRAELPDGATRDALAQAIREGAVSGIQATADGQRHLIALAWVSPTTGAQTYRSVAQALAVWALVDQYQASVRNARALWLLFLDGHQPGDYFDGDTGVWRVASSRR